MSINIVTGGSSGLGFCIAKKLVSRGEHVLVIGRNSEKLATAVQLLQALNHQAIVKGHAMDLSKGEEVSAFYREIQAQGKLTRLFNVAGVGIFGPADKINEKEIDLVVSANLKGLILMTSGALKLMESSGGKIVNVISTAGLKGKQNESLYCASKWGARGFTEALKAEYKGSKIQITGIYPGGMKTAFWDDSPAYQTDTFMDPEEVAVQIVENVFNENLYISDMVIERK